MNKPILATFIFALLAPAVFAQAPKPQAQAAKAPAPSADLKRAQEIVNGRCSLCHGAEGESASPIFPRLAGQQAAYTERQLKQFNTRERNNDNAVMHSIASKLGELEIKALAEYISGID